MSDMPVAPQGDPAAAADAMPAPGGPPLGDGMLEGEQEMFEGGGLETDALPIPVNRMAAQQLLDTGEVEINVQLEEGMVDLRLFIDEEAGLDTETLDTGGSADGGQGEPGLDAAGVV